MRMFHNLRHKLTYAIKGWWYRAIFLWSTILAEKHTCPERLEGFGPWERKEGIDTWRRVGRDRVCSFCGSMHPEDYMAALKNVDGLHSHVELNDGRYKVYIRRPGVQNAGQGAIKFYLHHGRAYGDDLVKATNDALRLSRAKDDERFNMLMARVRSKG